MVRPYIHAGECMYKKKLDKYECQFQKEENAKLERDMYLRVHEWSRIKMNFQIKTTFLSSRRSRDKFLTGGSS
jgi:hypothetical protein